MGSTPSLTKPISTLITLLGFLLVTTKSADYTNLIFKGCANQQFQDPTGVSIQNLNNLLNTLVSQSSTKTFSTTTTGEGQNSITGLFQCRGDLSHQECYNCISKIPKKISELCGKAIASRVQLSGCYLTYQVSGFTQSSGTELLYKFCGSTQVGNNGFDGWRETALDMVVSGVKSGGVGFYAGSYQSIYVLGQCEGDLASGDCEDCVKSGVGSVKSLCGDAASGQVYLNKCYVSYSYYANGVPSLPSSESTGTKQHTQRTVAIAVGGVAALGFLIVLLLCAKSLMKKPRDY